MNESLFNSITDNLPFALLVVSTDETIVAANLKVCQLLQIPSDKLVGQNLSSIVEDEADTIQSTLRACSRSRTPCPVPLTLSSDDNVISSGFLFTPASKNTKALVALRIKVKNLAENNFFVLNQKINEQNQIMRKLNLSQAALKQELDLRLKTEGEVLVLNAQLEEKVRTRTQELQDSLNALQATQETLINNEKMSSLGRLVAGVSHEVSTPIGNCLLGLSFVLEQTQSIHQKLDQKSLNARSLKHYLGDVEKLSESLLISLNHTAKLLSSFKEIAVDQHSEEKRTFNLKKYVDTVLLNFKGRLKDRPIEVKNKVNPAIELHSYAGVFSQVITNMVMNSLTHGIEDEGLIEINADYSDQGDAIIIVFSDNGMGIDEALIDKVFDPFFSTKFGQGGSGLGLSIVHNLVTHKLKGNIRCVSRPGLGTQMVLTLPITEVSRQSVAIG